MAAQDKMILGVCTWLAPRFNVDVTVLRVIFVILVLGFGTGILLYLALFVLKALSND